MVRCCLYRKGKNFKANHNLTVHVFLLLRAVAYIAKVRILKQITTFKLNILYYVCCWLYSKGKNFRANHNEGSRDNAKLIAVVYIAKVRILEQITTRNNAGKSC